MPAHAAGSRIQVNVIIRDLCEDKLEQLTVPAFGFFFFFSLFFFPFPELSEAVLGKDFSFSGCRVYKEPQDVPPGPTVFFCIALKV